MTSVLVAEIKPGATFCTRRVVFALPTLTTPATISPPAKFNTCPLITELSEVYDLLIPLVVPVSATYALPLPRKTEFVAVVVTLLPKINTLSVFVEPAILLLFPIIATSLELATVLLCPKTFTPLTTLLFLSVPEIVFFIPIAADLSALTVEP